MSLNPAPDGYPLKLVRDNTASIVNPSGEPGDLFYRPYTGDVGPWLRKKLGEEVLEYLVDGGTDELGQVLGLVEALAEHHGLDLAILTKMMQEDPRGGFRRAIMMYGRHPEYDK